MRIIRHKLSASNAEKNMTFAERGRARERKQKKNEETFIVSALDLVRMWLVGMRETV